MMEAGRMEQRRSTGRWEAWAASGLLALLLAGCANDGVGMIFTDPAKYSAYHCKDMATRLESLRAREKELAALMNRASSGTGGAVIGTLAYRSDYESVLTEQRMLHRLAAEKKCELEPRSQSDQVIR
jgi:hypothetical protein